MSNQNRILSDVKSRRKSLICIGYYEWATDANVLGLLVWNNKFYKDPMFLPLKELNPPLVHKNKMHL